MSLSSAAVLVAGVGTMGTGIAQLAAQAGHTVFLFDLRPSAAIDAKARLESTFATLVSKGKLPREEAEGALSRLHPLGALSDAASAGLAIEAVTEDLIAKRTLLAQLEALLTPEAVLATNTSSLSITELATGLKFPHRLVGMHFFNPVPQMRLVEVVSGLHTGGSTVDAIVSLARSWGKTPVVARSTPGFIVNRIARPFYGEALALLRERAAEPTVIDRCIRGAGFRMGPCELMDLIGHDVNSAVTEAVFRATFGDQRYVPSPIQRELVDAGWLGRKSGRGFFEYGESAQPTAKASSSVGEPKPPPPAARVVLHGMGVVVERCAAVLKATDRPFEWRHDSDWTGLAADEKQLRLTDGRPAAAVALLEGVADVAVFDLAIAPGAAAESPALAWAAARGASDTWQRLAPSWLAAAGFSPQRVGDASGLVAARTIAMLINEAADAVLEGVCDADSADMAMRLAMNFPEGPFEWLKRWDTRSVVRLLDHLHLAYRGARYRVSPELRQRAWLCQGVEYARTIEHRPS